MAEMNDISELLGMLFSGDGDDGAGDDNGGIDPELLIKLLDIVSKLNESDENTALLTALRPLLRAENRPKLDRAAQILKLMSILRIING